MMITHFAAAKSGDLTLSERKCLDSALGKFIEYLADGVLARDVCEARGFVFSKSQYTMMDGVLCHVEKAKTLQIIPPITDRQ